MLCSLLQRKAPPLKGKRIYKTQFEKSEIRKTEKILKKRKKG